LPNSTLKSIKSLKFFFAVRGEEIGDRETWKKEDRGIWRGFRISEMTITKNKNPYATLSKNLRDEF
jgi:hypothetical protein